MDTKICSKCNIELSIDMFYKSKTTKDGLLKCCKKCSLKQQKEYQSMNKPKIAERKKQYGIKNKDTIIAYNKEYRKHNKEKISIYNKQYAKNNIMKMLRQNAYGRQWYINNRDRVLEEKKIYAKEHLEKNRITNQIRRSNKLKLLNTLTLEQWLDIKQHFNDRCAYCGKELPLEQEHFIPLSQGGEYTVNNIIPSCKSCNCSKNDRDFFKWYKSYRYYSKKREAIILKYLSYNDNKIQQLAFTI